MKNTTTRKEARQRRHVRIRKRIAGTADCPRLSIMVSNKNMYVQFIDDVLSRTLASVSTRDNGHEGVTVATGEALGKAAAEVAEKAGITKAVVDRGGFKFHGRVAAIVQSAVDSGLQVGSTAGRPSPVEDSGEEKE